MHYSHRAKVKIWEDQFFYLKVTLALAPVLIFTTAYLVSHALNGDFVRTQSTLVVTFTENIISQQRTVDMAVLEQEESDPILSTNIIFHTTDYAALEDALRIQTVQRSTQTPEPAISTGTIYASTIWSATGATKQCFTYMGWQMITNTTTKQYRWRAEHYPDWDATYGSAYAFDDEGFGKVDGRYVVATSNREDGGLAIVGQSLDVVLQDGTVIPCIVGEAKSVSDANWTKYGHLADSTTLSIVEFCVNKQTWYEPNHKNPGTAECHPEWSSPLDHIVLY